MKTREVAYLQLLAILHNSNTPRGRKNLAEELKIGEGVVRTLLEGGRDLGHVAVLKGGVKITDTGQTFLKEALGLCGIADIFTVEEARKLLCGKRCVAHVMGESVRDVVATRDSLVRLGACGALIVERRGDTLLLPPLEEPLEKYSAQLAETLKTHVGHNATIIIACGDTFSDALGLIELKCHQSLSL
ncbi:MAG: DUF4443 domain-containing protein [Pyrobaculum sp.]|jgi:DNA-binding transcriptional regulator LsrR (DeoR family)